MTDTPQRVLQAFIDLLTGIPPLASVVVLVAVLGLTLWSGGAALHSYRILDAVANAPVADLRSNASGLVKLHGVAQPPPAPPGFSPSETVWHKSQRRSGSSSTTSTTVGHFFIRDEHAVCTVDSAEAEIVATTSESGHAFLDTSRTFSEETIRAGDPVTAIGELRRDLPAPPGMSDVRCQLVRSGGVLLVSGSPERQVKVLYRIWFIVQLPFALLSTCVLALGILILIGNQAEDGDSLAGRIIQTLLSTEHLEPGPGEAERQLLAISAPFGLQLPAAPAPDYVAQGWVRVDVATVSMFAPPGWVVDARDDSALPSVGLVAPGNDAYIELRVVADVLRRPGIALETALENYASAKERGDQGIVLGYTPLGVDGAIGHVEIMNSGGVVTNPDGSLAHRLNRYTAARRFGEMVFTIEFRASFAQADQDRFGPMVLDAIRSIRFNPADGAPAASDAGSL